MCLTRAGVVGFLLGATVGTALSLTRHGGDDDRPLAYDGSPARKAAWITFEPDRPSPRAQVLRLYSDGNAVLMIDELRTFARRFGAGTTRGMRGVTYLGEYEIEGDWLTLQLTQGTDF
jgi:hypothetical protein